MNDNIKLAFLVEDDPVYKEFVRSFLTGFGFLVVPFIDSRSCVEQLRLNPDLIVLDQRLSNGETGLNLLHQIRRKNRGVPVLMMSGHNDINVEMEAKNLDILDFIHKDSAAMVKLRSWVDHIRNMDMLKAKRKYVKSKLVLAGMIALSLFSIGWLLFS